MIDEKLALEKEMKKKVSEYFIYAYRVWSMMLHIKGKPRNTRDWGSEITHKYYEWGRRRRKKRKQKASGEKLIYKYWYIGI